MPCILGQYLKLAAGRRQEQLPPRDAPSLLDLSLWARSASAQALDALASYRDTDPVTARDVANAIRRELRSLVLAWIAICGAVGIALGATGARSWAEAAWIAVGLLPFAVPMVPMLWLHVGWGGFGVVHWYGWRPVVLVFSWSVATALPAFGLAALIWRSGGLG